MLDPEPVRRRRRAVPNPLADNAVAGWIEDTGLSWIWVVFWLGILASLFAGALAVDPPASSVDRGRATADDVARLGGRAHPARAALCGASSWVLGDALIDWIVFPLLLVVPGGSRGLGRDRGRALPPVRDRAARQPHARLRGADVLLLGVYVGDHGRARRPRRRRLRVGRRAGDARRRARVPAAARADPGTRRPALPARTVRGRPPRPRLRGRGPRRPPRARGDRRGPRRGARRPARRALLLASRDRGVRRRGRRARRASATTHARSGRSSATTRAPRCCSTTRRCSSGATCSTASSPRPRSRSRWRGCGSRCASSSPRSRPRATRIVEAGYEERRRLERDLHDGAQQRLVSLGVQLRRLQ